MESIYRQFFREITQTFMKEDFPWIQIMVWNVSKKLCTYVEQLLCKINTFIIFRQINWDLELSWFWNNALIFVNSHRLYWLKWSQNHERVKSKIGNVPKFSWNQKRRSCYLSVKLSLFVNLVDMHCRVFLSHLFGKNFVKVMFSEMNYYT